MSKIPVILALILIAVPATAGPADAGEVNVFRWLQVRSLKGCNLRVTIQSTKELAPGWKCSPRALKDSCQKVKSRP
jgi:hypothetical protein